MRLIDLLDMEKFTRAVRQVVRAEIVRNFMEGGRYGTGKYGGGPQKWKPSKRAILQHGKTLIDTGNLMQSIYGRVDDDNIVVYVENVPYAEKHQEGLDGMPRRPFLTLPDEFDTTIAYITANCIDENKLSNLIIGDL